MFRRLQQYKYMATNYYTKLCNQNPQLDSLNCMCFNAYISKHKLQTVKQNWCTDSQYVGMVKCIIVVKSKVYTRLTLFTIPNSQRFAPKSNNHRPLTCPTTFPYDRQVCQSVSLDLRVLQWERERKRQVIITLTIEASLTRVYIQIQPDQCYCWEKV